MLQEYAAVIHAKGAPLDTCFGFVDGTIRPISRPGQHQRVVYNGHKRVLSLKSLLVALLNGLIGSIFGPANKLCCLVGHKQANSFAFNLLTFESNVFEFRRKKTQCKHVGGLQPSPRTGQKCLFPERPAHDYLW